MHARQLARLVRNHHDIGGNDIDIIHLVHDVDTGQLAVYHGGPRIDDHDRRHATLVRVRAAIDAELDTDVPPSTGVAEPALCELLRVLTGFDADHHLTARDLTFAISAAIHRT